MFERFFLSHSLYFIVILERIIFLDIALSVHAYSMLNFLDALPYMQMT